MGQQHNESIRRDGPARLDHWAIFAVALTSPPSSSAAASAVTMLSQIGIAIVACLSYNMLLGQAAC